MKQGREISTVLLHEHQITDGKPIAAVAWEGDDWAISPARDAPPAAVARVRARLRKPIAEAIERLRGVGQATSTTTVKAANTTDAARLALQEAGLHP